MSNEGFQPPTQSDNDNSFSQGGFQDPNSFLDQGFQPVILQQGKVDTNAIAAFTKGSTQAIPIGYEKGYASSEAKKKGQPDSSFSQLGFIDTTQSVEYGRGYAYGFAQGFALGYAQGLNSATKFNNTGFQPVSNSS